jgi:hypothetical protein
LEGNFAGREIHHPMGEFTTVAYAEARVVGAFELNGLFLVRDYTTYRNGEILYRGKGLYGWDDARRRYTIWWFDTAGTEPVAPAYGIWRDDTLIFEYQRTHHQMRLVYQFFDGGRYTFVIEGLNPSIARWEPVLEGEYARLS